MDRINEILALLETPDSIENAEIETLCAELIDLFHQVRAGEIEDVAANDVPLLTKMSDGAQNLRALAALRIEALEAEAAELDALEAVIAGPTETEDGETEATETEDEAAAAAALIAEAEAATEAAAAAETVTAAGTPAAPARPAISKIRERAGAPKVVTAAATPPDPRVTIVSSSGVQDSLTAAAVDMSKDGKNVPPNAGKRSLVTIKADYPESHQLDDVDWRTNGRKFDAVVAAAREHPDETITAAGGWQTPPEVRYELITQALANRPIKNALPNFAAPRMSVTLPTSPTLADIGATFVVVDGETPDTAVSVWTTDDDAAVLEGTDFTKPIQRVTPPEYDTFETYAVVARKRLGNFAAKANPENVDAWNKLILARQARVGECLMLGRIKLDAGTTLVADPDPIFGAARDILEQVLRISTFMRSAERADENALIHAALPSWVVSLMQSDLVRTNRADMTADLVIARDRIITQFGNAGIRPTFYIDTPVDPTTGAFSGSNQILRKQTDGGASALWPATVQYGLWFEGHFGAIDNGQIDLGVVRSPELNEVNDWETFAETFEGVVAHRGPEAVWVSQTVRPDGSYAAGIDGDVPAGS